MKIEQLDTPFLYLDEDGGGECVAIHPAYLPSHLPGAKQTEALRPHKMEVDELQHALGLDSLVERISVPSRWMQAVAPSFRGRSGRAPTTLSQSNVRRGYALLFRLLARGSPRRSQVP